jgi:hypothetical protein
MNRPGNKLFTKRKGMGKLFFCFVVLFLSVTENLNAQDNLKVGAKISGGYTAISDPFLMGVRYRALINDSYPFHAGAYAEYKLFKIVTIHSGINLGYERCNLLYKDIVGTDSILNNDPNANSLYLLNNPLMIYDHINSFSVSIPLIVKLKLISNFFVSAGLKVVTIFIRGYFIHSTMKPVLELGCNIQNYVFHFRLITLCGRTVLK